MPMSIRDPEVYALARKVAKQRGTTMTGAVKYALESVVQKKAPASKQDPKVDELEAILDEFHKRHPRIGPAMTKEEIDAMWED
jgi:antitoxin VapB